MVSWNENEVCTGEGGTRVKTYPASGLASLAEAEPPSALPPRLRGRWLVIARIVWLVLFAVVVGIVIVSIPTYFAYLHILTASYNPRVEQITQSQLRALETLGFSLDFYAVINIVLNLLQICGFLLVGGVLFWRKADNRMAFVTSAALITFPIGYLSVQTTSLTLPWSWLAQLVSFIGPTSLSIVFYLFPSGRFVPRWIGWLSVGWILYEGFERFFFTSFVQITALANVLFFALLVSIVAGQIYRYRWVSTPMERQQTKWFVFGSVVGIVGLIATIVLSSVFLHFVQPGMPLYFLSAAAINLFPVCIPVSLGIAILRSQLFDIDVIINQTLVYGSLTGILAALYAGLIIGLGSLVGVMTRQPSQPVVLVISTLVIAALFLPVRRRLQATIDRRFYRHKYDAESILASFSATLRNEIDLTELSQRLVEVVQETMQPDNVSLWLRPSPRAKEPHTISR